MTRTVTILYYSVVNDDNSVSRAREDVETETGTSVMVSTFLQLTTSRQLPSFSRTI